MPQVSGLRFRLLSAAVAAIGFGTLSANHANAATYLFDTNGAAPGFGTVNGGSFNWDDANWTTSTAGTATTVNWPAGNFPKFSAGASGDAYTVTVASDESIAGIQQSVGGVSLTINATGSGTLDMASGLQGIINSAGSTLTINAPISGTGGVQASSGGNVFLNGTNTYSGGTNLASTATLINYNNGSSFGTGAINLGIAGFAPLLGHGGTTITIPNDFTSTKVGGGVNFATDANTPIVSTGNWSLGANNLVLRNNGNSTSPLTLSGVISGTANVSLSANNNGTILFSGANTYTGSTTVGVGSSPVTLKLGAANTIASSVSLILAGGILNPGGFNQNMGGSTLGLTAASTIDFAAGASELDFANSSGLTWAGTLNLLNFDPSLDKLRFGTDATGLTSAQLADIEFNGAGLGTAGLDAAGYLVVPEPASLSLLGLGATALLARCRRA